MKPGPPIHIRKMRVRVPGTSLQDGHAAAERLRERLENLPAGSGSGHIGAMRLRVQSHPGADSAAISDSVATAISSKLARNKAHSHA